MCHFEIRYSLPEFELHFLLFLVLSKCLDIEHLISQCIQISKKEDTKTAEARITEIIHLKHTLELVQPLMDAIADGENPLFTMYAKVSKILPRLGLSWS